MTIKEQIKLSTLAHTWLIDVDGTLVKHNGYKLDGYDSLLEGVKKFFEQIPQTDKIILLTDMPMGERILINDLKPSGLKTAYAVNKIRDEKLEIPFEINEDI